MEPSNKVEFPQCSNRVSLGLRSILGVLQGVWVSFRGQPKAWHKDEWGERLAPVIDAEAVGLAQGNFDQGLKGLGFKGVGVGD